MYDHNYTLAAEMGYDKAKDALHAAAAPVVYCYARDFNRSQYQSTVTTEVNQREQEHTTMSNFLFGRQSLFI